MNHHGINQPRGMNAAASAGRRFGKMFPDLPRLISNPHDLVKAGEQDGPMDESGAAATGSTSIPLGFVFLGQFIDHDITLDVTSSFDKINDESAIRNFRTPALDLDCIYGAGPEASPHLYYQTPTNGSAFQKAISGHHLLTNGDDLVRAPSYPEDNDKRTALIGDPRNDENRIVSQIQLTMMYFHNAVFNHLLDEAKAKCSDEDFGVDTGKIFEEAQRMTRWHYQWVVVHDFLKHMVGKDLVDDILCNGTKLYKLESEPYIPIEFAVAAYRFGHTMVTNKLKYNDKHQDVELFGPELGDGFSVNHAGAADMSNFFGPTAQPAGAVDIFLPSDLLKLPFMPAGTSAADLSLATRNLMRSQSFGLPSGQNVHAAISEILKESIPRPDLSGLGLPDALTKSTPLWLYILAEGSIAKDDDGNVAPGFRLGPVGGRIVAETLIGLLESDNTSYMGSDRSWCPQLADVWDMVELTNFAEKAK